MMNIEVKNKLLEKIFSAIQSSYTIDKHIDFFTWLQNSVSEVLPHDMLLASWGDFEKNSEQNGEKNSGKNKLNYDVASNVSDVNTQIIFEASDEIDNLMLFLHQNWLNNNRRWYVINSFNNELDQKLDSNSLSKLNQFNSLLVYGVSDLRGSNECLYVFFSKQNIFEVQDSVMGLIMPHIDNVLRRIQHLEPLDISDEATVLRAMPDLSSRELEVIHWIKSGKSNQEISIILKISPNTVKSHLKRIFKKLNVSKRAQAVALLASQQITKLENETFAYAYAYAEK